MCTWRRLPFLYGFGYTGCIHFHPISIRDSSRHAKRSFPRGGPPRRAGHTPRAMIERQESDSRAGHLQNSARVTYGWVSTCPRSKTRFGNVCFRTAYVVCYYDVGIRRVRFKLAPRKKKTVAVSGMQNRFTMCGNFFFLHPPP